MQNKFITRNQFDGLEENEQLFIQLMQKALKGEQSTFEFIGHWGIRSLIKQYIKGVEHVIKVFTNLEKSTYKTYLSEIEQGIQNFKTILALRQFNQCRHFYEIEKLIAEDMLNEHLYYVFSGHIWDTLIGNDRKEEDLVDYRTLWLERVNGK